MRANLGTLAKKTVGAAAMAQFAIALAACNIPIPGDEAPVDFNSGLSQSESMAGKVWQTPTLLEVNPGNPALFSGVSHRGFSLYTKGDTAQLAVSLYNSDLGDFAGYIRAYHEGTGWALPGSQFRIISNDLPGLGDSPGQVAIGATPAGTLLASFFGGSSPLVSVVQNSGVWGSSTAKDMSLAWSMSLIGSNSLRHDFDFSEHQDSGAAFKTVFDSFGRAYTVFRDSLGPAKLHVLEWTEATGLTNYTDWGQDLAHGGMDVGYSFDAVSDGKQRMCFIYEAWGPVLLLTCFNGVTGNPYQVEGPTQISSGTDEVMGSSIASDGNGGMMAVYYQKTDSEWRVYAVKIQDGVAEAPVRIDLGLPDDYVAAPDGCSLQKCPPFGQIAYPRPAVAHVGGGFYVAAWVATDITQSASAVFGATYNPVGGWGPGLNATPAVRYTYRPSFHSPRLHGNGNGDAVLAVRVVTAESSLASPRMDSYKTFVARYHREVGFRKQEVIGNGCRPNTSEQWAACTSPPAVGVFDDGDAVVVFQDQDQNLRYRLKSVEFKK